MPKVIGYTPPWLSKPSPGAKIFSDPEPQSPVSPSKRSSYFGTTTPPRAVSHGARRLIANRGTEVFTVVGNKIRWADLSRIKDDWEERSYGQKTQDGRHPYRTLLTPVYYQITQLIISPSGAFLAICTEHTVHIAVLPDSSRLADQEHTPLKLKTYQLGPTTHVIPESPLASVLWHPLAASTSSTDCLVTITTEAAVRVWEIDCSNSWSFDHAALAIDLRKLADGVSSDQDFTPSTFGKNKGFSVDVFEMEASAACFGGLGTPHEDPWASMTLWTAMSNGDVYALCPLLPRNWVPTPTTIPALSVSAVSQIATFADSDMDKDDRKAAEQQYEWVQEIDNEEPFAMIGGSDSELDEIRRRPTNPSTIPRLQGPFELHGSDQLEEGEVTDIYVIAARLDEDALLSGEDDYEMIGEGIQFTIVCLGTTTGQLLISLELEGVSGQWLPQKERGAFSVPVGDARDLVLLDTVKCTGSNAVITNGVWPLLTSDPSDVYRFFATVSDRIKSVSLTDWASRVGIELSGDYEPDAGLHTRLALACQTTISVTQEILSVTTNDQNAPALSAPVILHDVNLGNMLVTHANGQAQAASFDIDGYKLSRSLTSVAEHSSPSPARDQNALSKVFEDELPEPIPTRAAYAPAEVFYKNHMQPLEDLRHRIPVLRRSILSDTPIRLSPACLDIMTLAHRTFSAQTSNIEKAAAELFRRCERLREELADQVKQMSELADRLQHMYTTTSRNNQGEQYTFEHRITKAQERQKELIQRYEKLRRRTGKVGTANQDLSVKEEAWIGEIQNLGETILENDQAATTNNLSQRFDTVQALAKELLEQSRALDKDLSSSMNTLTGRSETSDSTPSRKSTFTVSSRTQKERIAEVMSMVERETAIIDAVMARLNKLNVTK